MMHGPQNLKKKLDLFYSTSRSMCWKLLQATFKMKSSFLDDYENNHNDDDDDDDDDDNMQVNWSASYSSAPDISP